MPSWSPPRYSPLWDANPAALRTGSGPAGRSGAGGQRGPPTPGSLARGDPAAGVRHWETAGVADPEDRCSLVHGPEGTVGAPCNQPESLTSPWQILTLDLLGGEAQLTTPDSVHPPRPRLGTRRVPGRMLRLQPQLRQYINSSLVRTSVDTRTLLLKGLYLACWVCLIPAATRRNTRP